MPRLSRTTLPEGVQIPNYERFAFTAGIVHFGPGSFHRGHQGFFLDALRNSGDLEWGMRGAGIMPGDTPLLEALAEQEGVYTIRETATDGAVVHRVVGAVAEVNRAGDHAQVLGWLTDPATRIVTMTVTEGGYFTDPRTGEFRADDPAILAEWEQDAPRSVFGYLVRALAQRRADGVEPFTVLSCDNLLGNGHAARQALVGFARVHDAELADWIDEAVATPSSMVDGITPVTKQEDRDAVAAALGMEDRAVVTCEPFRQWVVEDHFPTGRPRWADVGVELVTDVAPYEHMKLRMLNAAHQVMAHLGRLAGIEHIHEVCTDPDFGGLLEQFWRDEARPVCPPVPVDLVEYCSVLRERFSNAGIADTVERNAAQPSDRIPGFLLPTVADNLAGGGPIDVGALVVAAWVKCLQGIDEQGRELQLVDDRLEELLPMARANPERPLEILGHPQLESVGGDPRFREAFLAAYELLSRDGARAAARSVLQRRDPL